MQNNIKQQAVAYALKRRRKQRWHQVVTCLAAVVVFCTTYALILPAITLENGLLLGTTEHMLNVSDGDFTEISGNDVVCDKSQVSAGDFNGLQVSGGDLLYQKLQNLNNRINLLPTVEELEQILFAYEEADDMEGYESYFRKIAIQAESAYAIYEELSEEDKGKVVNVQKLLDLEWLWSARVLSNVQKVTVYGVNEYVASVMLVQDSSKYGMLFTNWDAVIVEKNDSGALYVEQIITGDVYKNNLKSSTSDGFVVLLYNIAVVTAPGDIVKVDFDYKNASGVNAAGFGTITFGSSGQLKPAKDNSDKLTIVPSADTKELIEVNLYNYGSNINTLYNSDKKYPGFQQEGGEASGASTYSSNFGNVVTQDRDAGINGLTNGGGDINATTGGANRPISGAMQSTLGGDGYPALADGTSLAYLFTDSNYAVKQNIQNINGLFQHNAVTGAYVFNSRENHAQFNAGIDTFTLYEQIITPNCTMYPFGNFLPFNDIVHDSAQVSTIDRAYLNAIRSSALYKSEIGYDGAYTTATPYATLAAAMNTWIGKMDAKYVSGWKAAEAINEYFASIDAIPDLDFNQNTELLNKLYCVDYDEPKNFYFGMEMKMQFMQPKGGLTGNDGQQPMVFYFTGDDDVWVYIDGVLFLDLSGIHRHVGGEIDFVKGEVRYYELDPGTGDVTGSAYKTVTFTQILGGSEGLSSSGTFADYTTHKFNFYYMERGAGSGVCRMNFNFPLLKRNSISVAKELTVDEQDKLELLGNPDFKFQVLKAESKDNRTEELFIEGGREYTLYDKIGTEIGKGRTDANGMFTLKAGQRAEFTDIKENAGYYYVRELLDPDAFSQYGSITVDGSSTITNDDVLVGEDRFTGVNSPVKNASDGTTVFHFNNQIVFSKLGSLEISKVLEEYPQTRNIPEFAFTVTLDGLLLPVGTTYTVNGENRAVETEGIVIVPAGSVAKIDNIIAGTEFTVQETVDSSKGYTVTYFGSEGVTTDGGKASGTIVVNSTVNVTVTNSENGTSIPIPIKKSVTNPDGTERTFTFTLTQVTDSTGQTLVDGGTSQMLELKVTSVGEGTFTLQYLQKDMDSLPKTFYYRITEDANDDRKQQIYYDQSVYVVEVIVVEDSSVSDGLSARITSIYKDGTQIIGEGSSGTGVMGTEIIFTNILLGDLSLEKKVIGGSTDQKFSFTLKLEEGTSGLTTLPTEYPAILNHAAGMQENTKVTFTDGALEFTMGHGESLVLQGIPQGAVWTLEETDADGYRTSWKAEGGTLHSVLEDAGNLFSGSITGGEIAVTCINATTYVLPNTGGTGSYLYTTGGMLLMITSALLLLINKIINLKKKGINAMKHMKKIASLVLVLVMVLTMNLNVLAAETGSITIKNAENVSVAGKTFKAYKILDLKLVGDGYVYTVPDGLEDFYAIEFELDKKSGDFDYEVTQKIAVMGKNSDELFAFAAKALAAARKVAENAGIKPAEVKGAEGESSVKFENLPLGYYVVEDEGAATPISALVLDSTNPDIVATLKADKPKLEKKIDGDIDTDKTTTGEVDYNNAAIGDKVSYVLTSKVPDMTGYTKYYYVVTDTLSKGLTFNNDVIIALGEDSLVVDKDYTVTVTNNDDTTTVKIVFINFIQYKENKGADITIKYSATVDEDAVIGTAGNPNKVQLEYSNNPNHDESGNPGDEPGENSPTGETPEDETRTYVTDLEIIKVDSTGNRLTGAEFTLTGEKLNKVIVKKDVFTEDENGTYWLLQDGTYTAQDPNGTIDGEAVDQTMYESIETKYVKETISEVITTSETVTATGVVGTDGVLRFEGLSAGTYTITEIKAPDGYNLLKDPITVTIGWTAPTEDSTECTWTYEKTGIVNGENTHHITIINNAGTILPSTGGIGTTIFYAAGGILVLAAIVLLITRRRMSMEK